MLTLENIVRLELTNKLLCITVLQTADLTTHPYVHLRHLRESNSRSMGCDHEPVTTRPRCHIQVPFLTPEILSSFFVFALLVLTTSPLLLLVTNEVSSTVSSPAMRLVSYPETLTLQSSFCSFVNI